MPGSLIEHRATCIRTNHTRTERKGKQENSLETCHSRVYADLYHQHLTILEENSSYPLAPA